MARRLLFTLEMPGAANIVKDLSQLKIELKGVGKEIRDVEKDIKLYNEATEEQRQEMIKAGKSLTELEAKHASLTAEQLGLRDEAKKFNKELREQSKAFDIVKNSIPDDSIIGLKQEYRLLRKEIDKLDKAARESADGLEKIAKADKIKKEIDEFGDSVGDATSRVGQYKQAITEALSLVNSGGPIKGLVDPLSSILGGGVGGGALDTIKSVTSALGPLGTSLAIAGAGAVALTGYVASITVEFERLNNQVANTTELTGIQLEQATIGVKTLSEVFNQDFNEVLQAANTLTKEVTGDFNKSIDLMKIGFIAGADANNEFLDSIREYSTQIREAGASGEEFIEILIRAQREGIYSDKGVDLVKEFGLRIREQTEATSKSLTDAFGEKFTKDLFKGINDGSITTVTALSKISGALKNNELTAKQTQQVLADTFGGPGEDAGLRFIEVLQDVDGNLEKLIDTSDAYTQKQLDIYDATTDLNTEQQILAAQFAGTGTSMDALKIKAKTLGNSLLNDLLLSFRSIKKEVEDEGFLKGLSDAIGAATGNYQAYANIASTTAKIILDDADALREVNEGEKNLAEQRRQSALEGKLSLQELVQEQALLRQELDAARISGEGVNDILTQYTIVTKNVAEANKLLNTNIKRTADGFKQIAADGSIEALSKKVSDLQNQIKKATPNKAKELVDDLNAAKLDLSEAKKELEEFKEAFAQANIDSLPTEERVEILRENIAKEREIRLAAARETLADSITLNEQLKALDLSFDIADLKVQQELAPPDTAAYFETINDIKAKTKELEDIEIVIRFKQNESDIQEARLIREKLLTEAFADEEQLQARLSLLRTNTDIASINNRLENEQLAADQRLQLEIDLQNKITDQRKQQARVDIDFDAKLDDIDTSEQQEIAAIIPKLDPNDVKGSLDALNEFEDMKTDLVLEKEIERLELKKELLEREGEDTLDIQNQIDERKLEVFQTQEERRTKLHDEENKKRLAQEQKYGKLIGDVAEGAGDILAGVLDGTIKSAEDTQKAFVNPHA